MTQTDVLYLIAGSLIGVALGYALRRFTVGEARAQPQKEALAMVLFNGTLARITSSLARIETQLAHGEQHIMGALEDITNAIDAETNKIASVVDKLRADLAAAQAKGDPPSAETLAHLQAISDRLKLLGADPSNPVPPAPDAPPAAPAPDAAPTT